MPEQEFIISRVYDAPRNIVFGCFTDVRHMSHWWGPKGITIVNATLDLRPGGVFHYGMKSADGGIMWGRFVYREIVVPERIVFINSFSDEMGGLTRAPFFDGKWPLEMLSTFLFEDIGAGKTRFTVKWGPHNASAEEYAVFSANFASMNGGWTGTLEKLEDYLATINR
jgi:uncharacterized protein YndB with AHSA1/START domain